MSSSDSSSSVNDAIANATSLLQILKDRNSNLIAESGSGPRDMVLEEKREEEEEEEIVKEVIVQKVENRRSLRSGSEGEEVREMQVYIYNEGEFAF